MNLPEDGLYLVALIIAAIDQIEAKGQSRVAWAVIVVCVGLLWHVVAG